MPGKNFKLKIRNYKLTRAFTLIEILVTISIISVLIATVTINYINIQKKARDGRRKADVAQIQQLLERYYQQHGKYPDGDDPGYVSTAQSYTNSQPWITGLSEFTNTLPVDPINDSDSGQQDEDLDPYKEHDTYGHFYHYYVIGYKRQQYVIMFNLENNGDPNRRSFEGENLKYSPCDETAYFQAYSSYNYFPHYDYCFSSPR